MMLNSPQLKKRVNKHYCRYIYHNQCHLPSSAPLFNNNNNNQSSLRMVNVKADPNVVANVITVGSPNGQLKSAFRMISRLCKAAPDYFNFAIIVGDLFGEEDEELADLLAEKIDVPLPTYFTVGFNPLPASVVEKLSNNQMVRAT